MNKHSFNAVIKKIIRGLLLVILPLLMFPAMSQENNQVSIPVSALPEVSATPFGTSSAAVPINMPPGYGPGMALVYSSLGGDGMAGTGWNLAGFPKITRDSRAGIRFDASDRFLTPDGLLFNSEGSVYRGEDNQHTIYEISGSPADPVGFNATTPRLETLYYGSSEESRLTTSSGNSVWALDRAVDANGNTYSITYLKKNGELYPEKAEYRSETGNTVQSVHFIYEDRSNEKSLYEYGYEKKNSLLLKGIELRSAGITSGSYQLEYDLSPVTGRARLILLTELSNSNNILSETRFNYQTRTPGSFAFREYLPGLETVTYDPESGEASLVPGDFNGDGRIDLVNLNRNGDHWIAFSMGETFDFRSAVGGLEGKMFTGDQKSQIIAADFNNDGLTDLLNLEGSGNHWIAVSDGAGGFIYQSQVTGIHGIPYDISSVDAARIQYGDFNGNGMNDILVMQSDGNHWIAFGNGSGGFIHHSGVSGLEGIGYRKNEDTQGSAFITNDFNGDGKIDLLLIQNNGENYVALSEGDGAFSVSASVHGINGKGYATGDVSAAIQSGDFNGDGQQDILRTQSDGDHWIALSRGDGSFEIIDSPLGLEGVGYDSDDAARVLVGDFNEDGIADLMIIRSDGNHRFFQNAGDTTFQAMEEVDGAEGKTYLKANQTEGSLVFPVDVNGDGITDLLKVQSDGNHWLALGTGEFPDLLSEVYNDFRSILVSYQPYPDHTGAVITSGRGENRIPASITRQLATDIMVKVGGVPKQKTHYAYKNGILYNPTQVTKKKFLGFETLIRTPFALDGSEDSLVPSPVKQETVYDHTVYDPVNHIVNVGGVLSEKTFISGGTLIEEKKSIYTLLPAPYTQGRSLIAAKETSHTRFLPDGSLFFSTGTVHDSFDLYGNPTQTRDLGDEQTSYDDTLTRIVYDYKNCPTGKVHEVLITGNNEQVIENRQINYDTRCRTVNIHDRRENPPEIHHITYNDAGLPEFEHWRNLQKRYEYSGESVTITYSDGTIEFAEKDPATGAVLTEKNKEGFYIHYKYDEFGRETERCQSRSAESCSSGDLITGTNYEALGGAGGVVVVTDSLGNLQIKTVNALGQIAALRTSDDRGTIDIHYTYDIFGRQVLVTRTDPDGTGTVIKEERYDELGRMYETVIPGPNGTITRKNDLTPQRVNVGNQTGFEKEITDPVGNPIFEVKDYKGRLIRRDFRTTRDGHEIWARVEYVYDAAGRPVQVRRGYGADRHSVDFDDRYINTITYDTKGRKLTQTEADKGTIRYEYDKRTGKLSLKTTADGKNVYYKYDNQHRLENIKDGHSQQVAGYTYYDSNNDYEHGKIRTITDDAGVRTFYYDPKSARVSRITRSFDGGEFDTVFEYDRFGRVTAKKYPVVNLIVEYTYFSTGALKEIILNDPDRRILKTGDRAVLARYENLNVHGKPEKLFYGNGVEIRWEYQNDTGMMARRTAKSGDNTLSDLGYTFRDDGLLAGINDLDPVNGTDETQTFEYDQSHRLIKVTGSFGDTVNPRRTLEYRYGEEGELIYNGERSAAQKYGIDQIPHRMTSTTAESPVSYEYNERGSVIHRKEDELEMEVSYNYLNRPEGFLIEDSSGIPSKVKYTYTEDGTRFKKEVTGGGESFTSYYLGDYVITKQNGLEVHTLLISKPDGILGSFSFEQKFLTMGVGSDRLHWNRFTELPFSSSAGGVTHLANFFLHWPHTNVVLIFLGGTAAIALLTASIFAGNPESRRRIRETLPSIIHSPRPAFALLLSYVIALQMTIGCLNHGDRSSENLAMFFVLVNNNGAAVQEHIGNHFYITNHLQSNSLVTNAGGRVIARYVYLPYGSLNQELTNTDMDGNGVYFSASHKYTGQEYDYETGLYNYKARLYDPETGRFFQTDPKHQDLAGWSSFDRYGYVHGNPVNMTDPTGEFGWLAWLIVAEAVSPGTISNAVNQISNTINNIISQVSSVISSVVSFIQKNPWVLLGGAALIGWLASAPQNIAGGLQWGSGGLERAGNAYSDFLYGKNHNARWYSHGSAFVSSAIRGLQVGMAIVNPVFSFLLDPAFTMGVWYTGASLVAGTVAHIGSLGNLPMPTLRYGHGGYVVTNSPLTLSETGITLGPFAQVGYGASEATIQHELAHVDQYNRMGGWSYMGHTWQSPFHGGRWAEHNADLRAGTNAYGGNYKFALLAAMSSDTPLEGYYRYDILSNYYIPFLK